MALSKTGRFLSKAEILGVGVLWLLPNCYGLGDFSDLRPRSLRSQAISSPQRPRDTKFCVRRYLAD